MEHIVIGYDHSPAAQGALGWAVDYGQPDGRRARDRLRRLGRTAMTARPHDRRVAIKRVYEPATRGDGVRILVDRLWPRGLRKVDANIDQWRKDLSPSTGLRQFYGHRPERFAEFSQRYRTELRRRDASAAVTEMVELNRRRPVTFLTASRDLEHSEAAVLAKHVQTTATRRAQASGPDGAERRATTSNPNRKGTRSR